ncbi:MAG TPA: J domain-containing protein [Candidatus Baltobacteraceae bacterium]|jgi:DnaJ-class molecular chaperone|nr:J domain-containing protein [Candidatus Baltobacteraceae bacterium]
MNYKDYYELLGVPKTAAEKDIKSAYRRLARKWHPDANPKNPHAAETRFKEIAEAYEVLGDPEKRRKYDALGSDWQHAAQQAEAQRRHRHTQGPNVTFDFGQGASHAGAAGGPSGFSDFFDVFFQGIGRRHGGSPFAQRGQDLEVGIDLTLADVHAGGTKSVSLELEDACPRCGGNGVDRNGAICPQCHGTGRTIVPKRLDVAVPKGVAEGQRIRLVGQGAAGPGGGPPGDLFLAVHIVEDKRFTRKGDDLYVDHPVSIYDLVLGGTTTVPTMNGSVQMTIPPGTQSHRLLRLTGKGMPKIRSSGYGDQYVRLIGMLPTNMSTRERELFTELAKLNAERQK